MGNQMSEIKRANIIRFVTVAVVAIAGGLIVSSINLRLDLTEDRRYTLSPETREILTSLENDVYIQVFLDGDMPVAFKRLRRSVREILDEFRVVSGRRVGYAFINPAAGSDSRERNRRQQELLEKGLEAVDVQAGDDEGGTTVRTLFPGMIVNYDGVEIPVNFLKNNPALPAEQNLLHSVEALEYELIQTIYTLTADTVLKVAFIEGYGVPDELQVADITLSMARFFTIDRGRIGGLYGALDDYAAIIVARPTEPFSDEDKFVIDQYIMNGGRVLWLYQEVLVDADSLQRGEAVAVYEPLDIADQLFRYGARVNPVLLQDMECLPIPLQLVRSDRPQIVPTPWPYYPLLVPSPDHPVTRNVNRVKGRFVSSVDTVGLDPEVRKSILLTTSRRSRVVNPPIIIALADATRPPVEQEFGRSSVPVAVLLEGRFESAFRNRMIPSDVINPPGSAHSRSKETRMIVISDADMIINEVSLSRQGYPSPLPLGKDRLTGQTFGNSDFLINSLNYLVDEAGLLELRSREIRLRLLNRQRVRDNLFVIQLINIVGPLLILSLSGVLFAQIRGRRYR